MGAFAQLEMDVVETEDVEPTTAEDVEIDFAADDGDEIISEPTQVDMAPAEKAAASQRAYDEALEEERAKNAKRAARFGIDVIEPKGTKVFGTKRAAVSDSLLGVRADGCDRYGRVLPPESTSRMRPKRPGGANAPSDLAFQRFSHAPQPRLRRRGKKLTRRLQRHLPALRDSESTKCQQARWRY